MFVMARIEDEDNITARHMQSEAFSHEEYVIEVDTKLRISCTKKMLGALREQIDNILKEEEDDAKKQ